MTVEQQPQNEAPSQAAPVVSDPVITPGEPAPVTSADPIGDAAKTGFAEFEAAAKAAEEAGEPGLFKAPDKVDDKKTPIDSAVDDKKTPIDPPKQKLSAQERIAQLTRKSGDKDRELAAERAEKAELKARIEALERGERPAAEADGDKAPSPDDKNPDGTEKYAFGELDTQFVKDMAKHEARQIVREERARDEQTRQEQAAREAAEAQQASWADQLETAATTHPDFVEKVFRGGEANAYALNKETFEMAQDSTVGAQVLYHLASNPKEALALYNIDDPVERARSFGRLEARFESGAQPPKAANPTTNPPKADPPAEHARGSNGQFTGTPSDFKSFEAKYQPVLDKQR